MKVAVALNESSEVSRHFGRTSHYLIALIENGHVVARDMRNALRLHSADSCEHPHAHEPEHKHTDIINLLSDCDAVICGGIGPRAVHDLNDHGIKVYATDQSDPELALRQLLSGSLAVATSDRSCQCHEHP